MARRLLRLLALLAMLMMPAGMASAAAVPMAAASATAGHCDEHSQPAEAPADLTGHCAGCSALPTFALPGPLAIAAAEAVLARIAIAPFAGIEPDTITPPPKLLSFE